jgi:hypothetical protein
MFWFPDTHVGANAEVSNGSLLLLSIAFNFYCMYKIRQLTHGYPYSIQCPDVDFELHS